MATLFEQIFGNGRDGVGGLLGNPAFMVGSGLLSNQGNPWGGALQGLAAAQGYKLSEAKMKKEAEQEQRLAEAQAMQMKAMQDAQKRQETTQGLLTTLNIPQVREAYSTPEMQAVLRPYAVANADPAALEQAGILAPIPEAAKPTALMTNLEAMGIDPQSDLGKQIMLGQMLKPQTSVNVNNAPSLPNGMAFVDPNNPSAGAQLIPGYAEAMAALRAAEAGGTQSPKTAAEAAEKARGKAGVTQMIGEIAQQYDTLRQGGGITSTQNDVTSNLLASVSKSGLGQAAGSAAGTVNQAARDSISMKRPMLIQAIKNATGMSAQQMNSNVELQQMINMATNPDFGYEVNQQQLRLIDALYGSGTFGAAPANADINALVNKYAN